MTNRTGHTACARTTLKSGEDRKNWSSFDHGRQFFRCLVGGVRKRGDYRSVWQKRHFAFLLLQSEPTHEYFRSV